jgi:glycosyltransferase involved in cell wall biosynthesis
MRLALIGPTYPYRGGIAHHTTVLCEALQERGHEVLLVSLKRQYPAWLFPGRTDQDPSRVPLQVDCEYLIDPFNPLSWWKTFHRVRQYEARIVIIQWWVPYWAPASAAIASLVRHRTPIQVLFICHNILPHERHLGDIFLTRLALSQGHSFIVHTEKEQETLDRILPGRLVRRVVFPTYSPLTDTSLSRKAARSALDIANEQQMLLFFGFVRKYKGLRYLLLAMPEVLEALPGVHLWIVGEFWDDPAPYVELIQELEIEHRVTVVNRYIPNEELPYYFQSADIVVLPYTDASQSAVVQLAYGFGRPVITTDVGGLREVVREGFTGLLVPPADSSRLAQAIICYLKSPEPISATEIRSGAQRAFSWSRTISLIEELAEA